MMLMMPVVCMGTNEVVEGPWRGPSLSDNYQVIITRPVAALCPGSSLGMCGMLLTMMLMRTMAMAALLRTSHTGP